MSACRHENTTPFIVEDESGIYRNNNYLIGVPLVSTQEEAVHITNIICNEFERINRFNDKTLFTPFKNIIGKINNSPLTYGQHLVIMHNNRDSNLISEVSAVIECTLDSDYLFTYVPVSPKTSLFLVKSNYYYNEEKIEMTKERFGRKYGYGWPDPYLSCIFKPLENLLTCSYEKDSLYTEASIKIEQIPDYSLYCFNQVIYEDGHKIVFVNENELERAKTKNPERIVNVF